MYTSCLKLKKVITMLYEDAKVIICKVICVSLILQNGDFLPYLVYAY